MIRHFVVGKGSGKMDIKDLFLGGTGVGLECGNVIV